MQFAWTSCQRRCTSLRFIRNSQLHLFKYHFIFTLYNLITSDKNRAGQSQHTREPHHRPYLSLDSSIRITSGVNTGCCSTRCDSAPTPFICLYTFLFIVRLQPWWGPLRKHCSSVVCFAAGCEPGPGRRRAGGYGQNRQLEFLLVLPKQGRCHQTERGGFANGWHG